MESDLDKVRISLEAGIDKYVKQQARNTIAENAERDKACAGYARIPGEDACDFCVTMGAHNDFYHTCESAGGGASHGTADDRYHPFCNCQICMIFKKNGKLVARDPITGKATDYDGAEMVRRYREASEERSSGHYRAKKRSSKSQRLSQNFTLNSKADPARDYFGEAEKSHPEELAKIKQELKENNVEITVRDRAHEAMGYGPASKAGKPGCLTVTDGMSYSAWLHEFTHFKMDQKLEFPGRIAYYENLQLYAEMEMSAYNAEIDLAIKNGYNKLAKQITLLRDQSIKEILEGDIW